MKKRGRRRKDERERGRKKEEKCLKKKVFFQKYFNDRWLFPPLYTNFSFNFFSKLPTQSTWGFKGFLIEKIF